MTCFYCGGNSALLQLRHRLFIVFSCEDCAVRHPLENFEGRELRVIAIARDQFVGLAERAQQ